jgi:hypothetical protein
MGIKVHRTFLLMYVSTTRLKLVIDIRTSTAAAVETSIVGCFTIGHAGLGNLPVPPKLLEGLLMKPRRCLRPTFIDIRLQSRRCVVHVWSG